MPVMRYPGSKEKLVPEIWHHFPDAIKHELWSSNLRWEYREPFFGAGAVGVDVLKRLSTSVDVWLNDIDFGVVCLWRTIAGDDTATFDLFNKMIDAFVPSADYFYLFKEEDGRRDLPEVQVGFRKLALHRMSFSGLGAMAGGPIGGKDQANAKYDVTCRWNPGPIRKDVAQVRRIFRRGFKSFRFTCLDFADVIRDAPADCFIYCDPPYYVKGPELYKHSMSVDSHCGLAAMLKATEARWVLSYDDAPAIRRLYEGWTDIESLEITYTTAVASSRRPKNREILIAPFPKADV